MKESALNKPAARILVIDDEETVARALTMMLSTEGYEVEAVYSGIEGIKAFKKGLHDIVLTDLHLGDIEGTDVLAEVKEVGSDCAVIIITGFATTESAVEAIRLGADDYLTKPVRMSELLMTVRNQLAALEMRKRIKALNAAIAEERDKLRKSVTELTLLRRIAGGMQTALSYIEGFDLILKSLVEEISADLAAIYIFERKKIRLHSATQPNIKELEYIANIINLKCGELFETELNLTRDDFEGVNADDEIIAVKFKSSVAVPLYQDDREFGLLVAVSYKDKDFQAVWSDFIIQLSQGASEFLTRVRRSVESQRHATAAIVEHTQDGIAVINPESGEILMNPVARGLFDLSSGKKPTMNDFGKLFAINIQEIWTNLRKPHPEESRSKTMMQSEITSQGQNLFLRLNLSILPGNKGESDNLLLVIHDITQERSMEEMKTRLMSNISHELRTPTAIVKEFISLILDGVTGPLNDTLRQYIKIIQSNMDRLARLIENLLTLARSDRGGYSLVLQPIPVRPVIENVASSMVVRLQKKSIRITTRLPDELPLVYGDQDAVTQILTNLVENAYKYSPENTEVVVTAKDAGAKLEISVIDQGYGIPQEDIETIFKRFHRLVDHNDPRFQEGVGLGLPLVKDFVTRHGGDIWVNSEVGKGSTFAFTLQVVMDEPEEGKEDFRFA